MQRLGPLSFVKKLCIIFYYPDRDMWGFCSDMLSPCSAPKFSAFTNLPKLGIDDLIFFKSVQSLRRCFDHFSPTLRSLSLRNPSGSNRLAIYFIGLFQHLEDLTLIFDPEKECCDFERLTGDLTPAPLFFPPLRGRFVMMYSKSSLPKDMIRLLEGIQFRSVEVFCACGVGLLSDACTETLKTLRLYGTNPLGE